MINVALFGFGRIGQMHAKNLTNNKEIKLLYTYEKINQLSNKAKTLYGCKIEKNYKSDLIEIHNRPNYLEDLAESLEKRNYVLYFHNDPLTMTGSKTILQRKFLLKNCYKKVA